MSDENAEKNNENSLGMNILFVAFIMGPALVFGYYGKPAEMGLSIVAGALVVAFINLDKFEFIKGGGFEARLKKIKKASKELKEITERLREVAKPLAMAQLNTLVWGDRIHKPNKKEKQKLIDNITDLAQKLNFNDDEHYKQILEEWSLLQTADILNEFQESVMNDIGRGTPAASEAWKALHELRENGIEQLPEKDEVMKAIGPYSSSIKPETMELLEDYAYYKKHRKPRRPEEPERA